VTPSTTYAPTLSSRDRAILRAVAAGRAEMTVSSEPDLIIDSLNCCDQHAAHCLSRAGLICTAAVGAPGARVRAALTEAGATLLRGEM
jgi:hypothetical protein